jgi:ribosomal protein S18 acetylase RimI-like enzyme
MMELMNVRPATLADVMSIVPLVSKLAALQEEWDPQRFDYKNDVAAIYEPWLRERVEDEYGLLLVAEHQGRVAAFLVGTIDPTVDVYRLAETAVIHDMWVEPEHRREHVARDLVNAAIGFWRSRGVRQIRCETAIVNEDARRLFAACGFRPSVIEMLCDLG